MSGNMGIGGVPPAGQNPDDFAIQYAKANGIEYSSMEELRNIMRNKFGDPQAPQGAASMPPVFITGYNGPVDLSSVSIMNGMMPMQPPMPMPMQLPAMAQAMGMPPMQMMQVNFPAAPFPSGNEIPPEVKDLLDKGIPHHVIAQGDDAVRKFAEENNISISAKKSSKSSSNSTSASETKTSASVSNSRKTYSYDLPTTDNAFEDTYNNFDTYKAISKSMNYTRAEKKEIKSETKVYKKDIDAWEDEAREILKDELEENLEAASGRKEKKALRKEYKSSLSDNISEYVQKKFEEKYPDLDFRAVLHNVNEYATNKGVLFARRYYVPTVKS